MISNILKEISDITNENIPQDTNWLWFNIEI
jgi:hypothetical protein